MAEVNRGYLPYFESRYYEKMGIFTKNENDNNTEDFDPDEDICDERIQDLSSSEIKKIGKGAKLMEASTPRTVTGTLYNPNGKKRWSIKARLHLDNPWWIVRLLRTDNYKGYVVPTGQNAVSYRLVTDHQIVKQHKLVQMLLTDRCTDNSAALDKFEQFIQMKQEELRLDIPHLLDLLQMFEDYLPDDDKEIVSQIKKRLTGFDGKMIKRAQEFPELFRYLPQLIPDHFLSVINTEDVSIIERLDFALKEEPWVFAFKRILVKEYNLMGIEVSQEVLRKCGILSKIPKLYQEAIELYNYVKKETNGYGHTCLHLNSDHHRKNLEKLNPEQDQVAALRYLYNKEILVRERIGGKIWTFPYDLWKSELNIAKGLNHLFQQHLNQPDIMDIDIKNNPQFEHICKDKDQVKAAEFIKNYPVVVISGKGGCGKTTVVTKVMSEAYKVPVGKEFIDNSRILVLYTAPTGKAAKLLGRKAGTDGYTLHQIIYSYRGYLKQKPESPWKFSTAEVLIVDECSMVAVHVFATLLDILLRNSNLKRVVFLGDVRQLPSVQPGNFLADMFDTFKWKPGCGIELTTNHRAESELIINNATKISRRRMPQFDDQRNYRLYPVLPNKHNPDQEEYENENFKKVLQNMLRSQDNMKDHTTSHIIAYRRNMCKVINQLAMEFYNPDPVEGRQREINKFRIGDKVGLYKNGWVDLFKWEDGSGSVRPVFVEDNEDDMIQPTQLPAGVETPCKNNRSRVLPYEKELSVFNNQELVREMSQEWNHSASSQSQSSKKEKTQKKLRLCNGEIYFIKDDYDQSEEVKNGAHRQRRYLKLSDEDPHSPTEFYALYSQLMRECKMTQAWAKTIHTFQGSECDTITFVVGNCKNQNWSHVYTAVTRGRSSVNIVGQEDCLQMSVENKQIRRDTGLYHQLMNIISADLRDELLKIARNGRSATKSTVQQILKNGTENSLSFDRSSVSTPYLSGYTTPTKNGITPSHTGYRSNQNGDSERSRSAYYQGSSGSSNHHKFKGQGSERYPHFQMPHNHMIQSPAKSRLFTEEEASTVAKPSECRCHDIKSCICGVTPISLQTPKVTPISLQSEKLTPVSSKNTKVTPISLQSANQQVDASPGEADEAGEPSFCGSQWSDISNTDDLFASEDQVLQDLRQQSDGDSDETLDMSGNHFDLSDDDDFFTEIKPESEHVVMSSASRLSVSASLSSLGVPQMTGQNLEDPSPKRPAETDDSCDYATPAKQIRPATFHTGVTPALKKLKF